MMDFSFHYKYANILLLNMLIAGLERCGLLWCFYQLFGLSFWRHPFTAEDPLLSKWWISPHLMKKQTHLHLGWTEGEYCLSKFSSLSKLLLELKYSHLALYTAVLGTKWENIVHWGPVCKSLTLISNCYDLLLLKKVSEGINESNSTIML